MNCSVNLKLPNTTDIHIFPSDSLSNGDFFETESYRPEQTTAIWVQKFLRQWLVFWPGNLRSLELILEGMGGGATLFLEVSFYKSADNNRQWQEIHTLEVWSRKRIVRITTAVVKLDQNYLELPVHKNELAVVVDPFLYGSFQRVFLLEFNESFDDVY